MRLGVCTSVSYADLMAKIGFEFIEVGASGIAACSARWFDSK